MSRRRTYLDLLNPDGSRNEAAFEAILRSRIAAETNLALCTAAGLLVPRGTPLGKVRAVRAALAASVDPALVARAERDRIAAHERAELTDFVGAMQRGAALQRAAMGELPLAAE
jgi:hypothetical protein